MSSSIQATIWCDNQPDGENDCPEWFQRDGKPHAVRRTARLRGWQQTRINGRHKGSKVIDLCPKCAAVYWAPGQQPVDGLEVDGA